MDSVKLNAEFAAAILNRAFDRASMVASTHASLMESGTVNEEATLTQYLQESVRRHPYIYGSAVAFEPNSFLDKKDLYSPYCYWKTPKDVELKDLGHEFYKLPQHAWYARPKDAQKSLWSEPYEDKGGGETWMTTYSVPFFYPKSAKRKEDFWGIATADLSLQYVSQSLKALPLSGTSYAFLLSREGRLLNLTDENTTIKETLKEISPQLSEVFQNHRAGFITAKDPFFQSDAWIAFRPIQNSSFQLALVYPQHEGLASAYETRTKLIILGIIGVAGLFITIYVLSHSVTKPIGKLANATHKIANGDFHQTIDTSSRILEVHDLAKSFQKMTLDLKERVYQLQETTATKERMAGELNAARRIQMSMLPPPWSELLAKSEPRLNPPKISLHAKIRSAWEVGGDFYDYKFLEDGQLSLLIGDVSGKGVPAAMVMGMIRTLFKSFRNEAIFPSQILAKVNQALCEENQAGMFVTLLYAVLDLETGDIEICNAGHIAPIRLHPSGEIEAINTPRNPALGLVEHHTFASARYTMRSGSRWLAYTDGITEAMSPKRELFGQERLDHLLQEHLQDSLPDLCEAIVKSIHDFSGSEELSDDLTIVAIEYGPCSSK